MSNAHFSVIVVSLKFLLLFLARFFAKECLENVALSHFLNLCQKTDHTDAGLCVTHSKLQIGRKYVLREYEMFEKDIARKMQLFEKYGTCIAFIFDPRSE